RSESGRRTWRAPPVLLPRSAGEGLFRSDSLGYSLRRSPVRASRAAPAMTQQQITRRLAAILAADIVGYSRMMEADEAGTVAALRQMWSETFNPLVAAHRGRVVKTMGDGALVEFASAIDAVECAVALQRAMAARNPSAARPLELRIGINLGDVIIDGDDILG